MTHTEAAAVLHINRGDSGDIIKKKYHEQIRLCHPDETIRHDDARRKLLMKRAQIINEAYRILIRGEEGTGERNHSGSPGDPAAAPFPAPLAPEDCAERSIYLPYEDPDGEVIYLRVARGRYLWNPEAEDFSCLTKSVLEVCRGYGSTPQELPAHFHRLMQAYIRPLYALRGFTGVKTGNTFRIPCRLQNLPRDAWREAGEHLTVNLRGMSLFATDEIGEETGRISFDEDAFYYMVLPLIREGKASAYLEAPDMERTGKGPCCSLTHVFAYVIMTLS
ncbi:MAG: J domain-containing protein [Lachnospiraceae bacterium]|nr:J domain-containing protein [Lachnospiraceae bacterium]